MIGQFGTLIAFDGGLTIAPALVAIAVAFLTKKVEPALLLGVIIGGVVASRAAPLDAATRIVGYGANALGFSHDDTAGWSFSVDHIEISAFSLFVAATIAVMGRAGGTRALIQRIEGLAKGRRGAMVTSWLAGMIVFFDDYANCLVVGSAMGPMCDRYRVSREKLAYIVDSTAAPIASLALVSTWVGYEVGLIQDALPADSGPSVALQVFLGSLPYRFYAIFTIVFVGAIAISGRDFGPMYHAERAASAREPEVAERTTTSPLVAAVPVGLLVAVTLGYLVVDGGLALDPTTYAKRLDQLDAARGLWDVVLFGLVGISDVLGSANPYHAMLSGSIVAFTAALVAVFAGGYLTPGETASAAWRGVKTVATALLVLFLAWALAAAMEDTGANRWITSVVDGTVPGWAFPTLTFLLAAATAFATGTSFGTMAILIPSALPVALQISGGVDDPILLCTTAAVLAGACLGDHASPISDTTVLSAIGAGTSLVDHVRTQVPYALSAGLIAILFGYLPVGLGVSVLWLLPLGAMACVAIVVLIGRPQPAQSDSNT